MSIRRPRGPKPSLKHLAFFEAMIATPEHSTEHRAARASLLTLRLFDEWVLLGPIVADGAAPIMRATRAAVEALHDDSDLQYQLARIVDGIIMLRDADANALLPRLAALAEFFTQRGARALAADVQRMLGGHAPVSRISAPTEAIA